MLQPLSEEDFNLIQQLCARHAPYLSEIFEEAGFMEVCPPTLRPLMRAMGADSPAYPLLCQPERLLPVLTAILSGMLNFFAYIYSLFLSRLGSFICCSESVPLWLVAAGHTLTLVDRRNLQQLAPELYLAIKHSQVII